MWVVLPAAILLGFRLAWGWRAQRRLEGSLARLRTMHVRLTPEEFPDDKSVPPGENAVDVLTAGPLGIQPNSAQEHLIYDPLEDQTEADKDALLKLLAAHQDIIDRIDAADACRVTAWTGRIFEPDGVPHISGTRYFADLTVKAACIAYERHQDLLALRHLNRLLIEARILEKSPTMFCALYGNGLRGIVAQGVEGIYPDLSVQDAATYAAAKLLLDRLLDDGAMPSGLASSVDSLIAAYHTQTKGFTCISLDRRDSDDLGWVLRPLAMEDWARNLDQWAAIIKAWRAQSWPEFKRLKGEVPYPPEVYDHMNTMLSLEASGNRDYVSERYERVLANLVHIRAAGLLLASRLYVVHYRTPPARLADLAAILSPKFPVDPFAGGQQPLHYRLDADGPTVWSVGRDGVNNQGDTTMDLVYGAATMAPPAPPQ